MANENESRTNESPMPEEVSAPTGAQHKEASPQAEQTVQELRELKSSTVEPSGSDGKQLVESNEKSGGTNLNVEESIEIKLEVSDEQLANGNTCERKENSNDDETLKLEHLKDAANQFELCGAKKRPSAGEKLRPQGYVRHIVAVLALSSIMLANLNRQAFNQAIARMTREQNSNVEATTSAESLLSSTASANQLDILPTEYPNEFLISEMKQEKTIDSNANDDDLFDWTSTQISWLQSGFAYGYTPFMIPGGRLSELYGAKWIVFFSGFGSALCSLLTPFLADSSFALLVGSRVLMGICQTGVSPALYALLTRWLPPEESSVYLPMIKVGVMLGFTCGSFVNGFLPWRTMFYLVGFVSLLWSVLWVTCVSSEPLESNFISKNELVYIRRKLGYRTSSNADLKSLRSASVGSIDKKRKQAAPWLRILTNPAVLGFMFCKFTVKLSTDAQTMQVPMFLKKVLRVSDELNGTLNACNFAIQAIFTGFVAYVAKEFVVRKLFGLNKTGVRRLFQGLNSFGMGVAYLLISQNGGSLNLVCYAVIFLSISSMFGAGGEAVLPVDLTTEYSASIMAIANSIANLSGMMLPTVVKFLLDEKMADPERWNHVWWFVCLVMVLGGLSFSLFARAEIQDFSSPPKTGGSEERRVADGTVGAVELTTVAIKSDPTSC